MTNEKRTVRSVFGKEIDLSQLDGVDVRTLMEVGTRLLAVEDGDPAYEYAWLDHRDPLTSVKIRKGFWEIVDPETDPVIAPGALKDGSQYKVNELVLVRMPLVMYKKLRAAKTALALRREAAVADQYRETVTNVSRQIAPDATGEPTVVKSEQVKEVREVPTWAK